MFCAPWSTTEQRSSCDAKNMFPDARKVCVPTKSLAIEESCLLRSPERTEAERNIVYEAVLVESWVHTHAECSSGPWAIPRVCWPSRACRRGLTPQRCNQSSAALVLGPPALCIDSRLSLGLALASFLWWQAVLSLSSSFARSLSHTWQWMITQVSFSVACGGSLEIHFSHSS